MPGAIAAGRLFAAATGLWAAALPAAAYAASRPISTLASGFSLFIYLAGAIVCHQRSERSFALWHAQLPVCARCTGIYVGAAILSLAWAAGATGMVHVVARAPKAALVLGVLPSALTLIYEWSTGHVPGNAIRAMAGAPLGGVMAALVAVTLSRGGAWSKLSGRASERC